MRLGLIIKEHRHNNQLSMGEFAKESGLSRAYISMLESNKNSRDGKPIIPSVKTLYKVSGALKITLAELLEKLGDEIIDVRQGEKVNDSSEVLSEYQKLTSDGKKLVLGLMKQINQKKKTPSKNVVQNVNGETNYVAGRDQIVNRG